MELNSKMVSILNEISNGDEGVHVSDILTSLKVSRRTFYYNFNKVKQWMEENELGTVELSEGTCYLKATNEKKLEEMFKNSNKDYLMSAEERYALELLYITLSSEIISIEKFEQMFDVCHNTILSDIRKQRKNLKEYKIGIKYSAKDGYFVEGEEFSIRKFLGEQIYRLEYNQVRKKLYHLLEEAMYSLTGERKAFIQLIREAIEIYEQEVGTNLVQCFVEHEVLMICIAYIRCKQGNHFKLDEQEIKTLNKLPAYKGVQKIVTFLRDKGLDLCEKEVYYITILLLGVKNFDFNTKNEENSYIREITYTFIDHVEKNANILIKDKEPLITRLVSHIGPMYYRVKYDLKVENPLLYEIKNKYSLAYEVTTKTVREMDKEFGALVDDNEIGYLTMYICGELNGEGREIKVDSNDGPSILIVCGAGVAASVLVRNQLIDLLGDNFEYVLCSASKVKAKDLSQYSLIVSTVMIDEFPDNVVVVSAVLSNVDKKKIISELNKCKLKTSKNFMLKDVMEIISRYSSVSSDLEKINFDLFKYFYKDV